MKTKCYNKLIICYNNRMLNKLIKYYKQYIQNKYSNNYNNYNKYNKNNIINNCQIIYNYNLTMQIK